MGLSWVIAKNVLKSEEKWGKKLGEDYPTRTVLTFMSVVDFGVFGVAESISDVSFALTPTRMAHGGIQFWFFPQI